MTLTPERIAEFALDLTGEEPGWPFNGDAEIIELCRLARLGLRVEAARIADPFPAMGLVDQHLLTGKRVALVVLE